MATKKVQKDRSKAVNSIDVALTSEKGGELEFVMPDRGLLLQTVAVVVAATVPWRIVDTAAQTPTAQRPAPPRPSSA